jgi:thioesterase domain-containing protein
VRRVFAEDTHVSTSRLGSAVDNYAVSTSSDLGASIEPVHKIESATRDTIADAVRAAVESAWDEVLGRRTFSANLSWRDAGGDSLNALRLWLRIENILGKPLELDAMDLSARPSEMIAAIERMLDASPGQSAYERTPNAVPLVFYMPPAEGDSPETAAFRAAFAGRIRFATIRYPSWREMIHAGGGFDSLVNAAEAQIRAHCQSRACFLAGYSFGGYVAWETAYRLLHSGWQIGFLGLIDTPPIGRLKRHHNGPIAKIGRIVKWMVLSPAEAHAIVQRRFLAILVGIKAFRLLRGMEEFAAKLRSKAAFVFRLHLTTELRHGSLRKWEPSSLSVPITLFRSDEFYSESPDYGWGTKCSQVTVVPIGGSHKGLLTQTDALRQRFLEAVNKASRKVAT